SDTPAPPARPSCPCQEPTGPSVALTSADSESALQIHGPEKTADSLPASLSIVRPCEPAKLSPAGDTPPPVFLTAQDLLRAHHLLRCYLTPESDSSRFSALSLSLFPDLTFSAIRSLWRNVVCHSACAICFYP